MNCLTPSFLTVLLVSSCYALLPPSSLSSSSSPFLALAVPLSAHPSTTPIHPHISHCHVQSYQPIFIHHKCRSTGEDDKKAYPRTDGAVVRPVVANDSVFWSVNVDGSPLMTMMMQYRPVKYTDKKITTDPRPVWADIDLFNATQRHEQHGRPKFNEIDGKVDRTSFIKDAGNYSLCSYNEKTHGARNGQDAEEEESWKDVPVPVNPFGRTGVWGRGLLGRWGPNHAADPIVSRWKRDSQGEFVKCDVEGTSKRVMEFVAIKRNDCGEWAIPGGMVEAGDTVSETLKKEFAEEALDSLEHTTPEEKIAIKKAIEEVFNSGGDEVYQGYVDDARNTDNAWMETVAMSFHAGAGQFDKLPLHAGDDAGAVTWKTVDKELRLYGNHAHFVERAVELRGGGIC
eukprot:Nk52_evm1s48 gene=Nk52_evmTU1s48